MRRSGSVAVFVWLALASTVTGEAQLPEQVSISWDGPPSCPRPRTLDAAVGQRLGADAPATAQAEIDVRVREQDEGGYELSLRVAREGPNAAREVQLADCSEVERAAVLLITTALSPEREDVAIAPALPTEPERAAAWSLRAGALGDPLTLPTATLGPSLGFGYGPRSLRVWAEARYLVAARSDRAAVSVEIDLFAGALGAAYVWRAGRLAFGPVVEAELGAQRAQSVRRGSAAGARWADWECVLLGALVDWETRARFGVSLVAAAGVPLRRALFEIDRQTGPRSNVAHETPLITARLQLVFRLLLTTKKSAGAGQ